MKYYEIIDMIIDNEYVLYIHNTSGEAIEQFKIYKDDAENEFVWDFGFSNVLCFGCPYGDLEVHCEYDFYTCKGDANYIVVAEDKWHGRCIMLGECASIDEAEMVARSFDPKDSDIVVSINEI